MERGLSNYIESIQSDIAAMVYSEGEGVSYEDKFTEYCIEILETIGKAEGARVLSYIQPDSQSRIDWKLNGYCLKDEIKESNKTYFETLDLYITGFKQDLYGSSVSKEDITKSLNQIKKFLNAAIKKHIDYIDPSKEELNQLIKIIGSQSSNFDRINIFYFSNGTCNQEIEKVTIRGLDDLDIFVHIWDIQRFYRIFESSSNREPIEIKFEDFLLNSESGIQCLKVPEIDTMFECYLAIVPGYILSKLYKEYSNELLESNVRAFLGQAGKYNKGIRDTIREKPKMFLPYNNGITATAENVETKIINGQLYLTKLTDFQIVNGGQTTASLYHTQKRYKDADLSKIFVQMKLTVIKEVELKNVEVPNIARFANSQNKVSELDLSSNNPYFVQIESLSRKKYVVNPQNTNQSILWYFERVNGQYRESLNKQGTPANQRRFKEQNPSSHKFVKSDIAKFINIWELEPHYVSQGAQKNFIQYTKKINEFVKNGIKPGENFYKKLIANAILFKTADKLFGRKNVDAIGDTNLKSFSVAYSLSYFHFLTENRLDLWKIYESQKVPIVIEKLIDKIQKSVFNHLVRSSNNTLFSEYAKKESSWITLKGMDFKIDVESIEDCLISKDELIAREKEKEVDINNVDDTLFLISGIKNLGVNFWDGLKKYIDKHPDCDIDYYKIFDLAKKLKTDKNLNATDLLIGKKVLEKIIQNPKIVEESKGYSKLEEKEIVDVKIIYDRMKLITVDDWKKILDIGQQTQIYNNLELSNLKSIFNSFKNKEKPKEQSLIKAFESMKKVKRFGIKV